MDLQDMYVGMKLRSNSNPRYRTDYATVVGRTVSAFAIAYDDMPAAVYPYEASIAAQFAPRDPEPEPLAQWEKDLLDQRSFRDLKDHPAVTKHGEGVTSDELASYVECFSSFGQSRIRGVGAEQYTEGLKQKFEGMSVRELAQGLLEELSDGQNYLAMISIKVLAALDALESAE